MAYAAERPNIIYIFTDQHTANAMSCAGNPDVHTPNLDRLAAAGIMFQNAYCTAPLSGPSRGAMFTGHYPGSVELLTNGAPLPEALQTQTLGTLVKNAGYECAYGGKWHVPELDIPDEVRGFDQIHRHSDDGLAEACVQFLSRKHDKPFFLVASYDNPHNICEYARSQNLPYGNMEIPEIRNCPGLPPNFAKNPYDADVIEEERDNNFNVYPTATFTPEDWRMYRYTYYRLVEKVDREIGKIIDAIDKNGSITIATRKLPDSPEVEIAIADTGKGIPRETLEKIFDPFFTTKKVGEGTGLGLTISYSIIEKLGGRIHVVSEEGKGTTFRITLPVAS